MHPQFSVEIRNVRFGLCTDGFNSFESLVGPYFYWPMILTVYNFPLGMCMKPEFMFLSTIIFNSNSSGRNIDVFLWPLIDELDQFWSSEVLSYYVSKKQNFLMKAALIWTMNNFLVHVHPLIGPTILATTSILLFLL